MTSKLKICANYKYSSFKKFFFNVSGKNFIDYERVYKDGTYKEHDKIFRQFYNCVLSFNHLIDKIKIDMKKKSYIFKRSEFTTQYEWAKILNLLANDFKHEKVKFNFYEYSDSFRVGESVGRRLINYKMSIDYKGLNIDLHDIICQAWTYYLDLYNNPEYEFFLKEIFISN